VERHGAQTVPTRMRSRMSSSPITGRLLVAASSLARRRQRRRRIPWVVVMAVGYGKTYQLLNGNLGFLFHNNTFRSKFDKKISNKTIFTKFSFTLIFLSNFDVKLLLLFAYFLKLVHLLQSAHVALRGDMGGPNPSHRHPKSCPPHHTATRATCQHNL
jgi:hypothetical protein